MITGEGGSGGALALAVADRVLMLENAVYSVISPEGCAAILWPDRPPPPQAARALRLTAPDLRRFGVVDEVVSEPSGGAHDDPAETAHRCARALRQPSAALDVPPATGPPAPATLPTVRREPRRRPGGPAMTAGDRALSTGRVR